MRFLHRIDALTRPQLCAAIFVLAALIRVLHLLVLAPAFEGYHWEMATELLRSGTIGDASGKQTEFDPLYPLFLAAVRLVAGDNPFSVQLVQLMVDAAAAAGLVVLADTLSSSRRTAAVAGGLYAVYPLLVRHAVVGDDTTLVSLLLIASVHAAVTAATLPRAAAAGLLLGLATLARFAVAPVAVLMTAALLRARGTAPAVVCALAAAGAVSPWLLRNHASNGAIWPTRSGENLLVGNSEYTDALLPEYEVDLLGDYQVALVMRERPDLMARGAEAGLDWYFTTRVWQHVREHPADTARLALLKAGYFFWPRLVPMRLRLEDTRVEFLEGGRIRVDNSPSRPLLDELVYSVSYGAVALAALAGLWIRRRDFHRDAPLIAVAAGFMLVAAVYFPATRYRAAMEFVLFFYAAVAVAAAARGGHETARPDR